MDFLSVLNKNDPHQRIIIHVDMDCYYAQVEEIRDPTLRNRPLGVQQKNIVVTCNYVARQSGVTKLMLVPEAKRLCPALVLVNGEDLAPYRQMSQSIFDVMLNYTPLVEKLGFDENFLDVSSLVETREQQRQLGNTNGTSVALPQVVGHIYPPDGTALNACECGCARRLAVGTQIAQEVRDELRLKLGLTCCAGVSYNKLLAKLVGAQNKPNQQTVLVSTHAEQFMRELSGLNRITGIGQKTESLLLESGIGSIEQLQCCDMDFLRKKFGFETATKLKDLSFGRDGGVVRPTGKPKTIGLEDSCRPISVRTDVEDRFRLLLMRLVEQVAEDGRIPIAIKVVLRKFDPQKKTSHRETKQANILPSLFKSTPSTDTGGARVMLADGAQDKLLKIIMRLFERVVDLNKPFHITLIGLAFSKFQQRKVGSSSIANFLIKKTDLEVQSITSLTNTSVLAADTATPSVSAMTANSDEGFRSSPTTFQSSDQFYRRRATTASPIPMLVDNGSESAATNSDFSDFSETEVEPSPKKSRIGRMLIAKRRCLGSSAIYNADTAADVASPSKLRVCDLRLNSRDSEKDFPMSPTAANSVGNCSPTTTTSPMAVGLPLALRFRTIQPPSSLLARIDRPRASPTSLRQFSTPSSSANSSPLPSPMDETASGGTTPATPPPLPLDAVAVALSPAAAELPATETNSTAISTVTTTAMATTTITNIPCPAGVDPEVFNELPLDVQNELIASWRSSLAAAAAAVANGNVSPLSGAAAAGAATQTTNSSTAKAGGAAQKNTLYRYFLRNK